MNALISKNCMVRWLLCIVFIFFCTINNDALGDICDKKTNIENCRDASVLDRMLGSWKDLNAACYLVIGSAYFKFYKTESSNTGILENAKKYLQFARKNLSKSGNDYIRCNELLIQAEIKTNPPNLQNIYDYLQVRDVRIEEHDKNFVLGIISTELNPYLTDFSQSTPPGHQVIDLYCQLSGQRQHRLFLNVQSFRTNYQVIQRRLKVNPGPNTLQDIQEIISLLRQCNRTMRNITQYITAYTNWSNALQSYNTPPRPNQACRHYNSLIDQFDTVRRQRLPFVNDPSGLECFKNLACLAISYESTRINNIRPIYNEPNLSDKRNLCKAWIDAYTATTTSCPGTTVYDDQRPLLNKMMQLYDAIEVYQTNRSLRALKALHQNSSYEESIRSVACEYLANHYYNIVNNELNSGIPAGPGLTPLQLLDNIGATVNLYNRYAYCTRQRGRRNISQQHSLLRDFYDAIQARNYRDAYNQSRYIDDPLVASWNVNQAISQLQPEPRQPEPRQPEPRQPEPRQPEPRQPEPRQPEPRQPEPRQPEPRQPEPRQHVLDEDTRLAREAFDSYEYFESWDKYNLVYPSFVPNSLNNFVEENESTLRHGSIWTNILSADRIRLKILSFIIKLITDHDPANFFNTHIKNRSTGYPLEYSIHLAERNHTFNEKSSDIYFFNALFYMKNANRGNQPVNEIIQQLLAAHNALTQAYGRFEAGVNQRLNMKKARIEYWLQKIWGPLDNNTKSSIRAQNEIMYGSIFRSLVDLPNVVRNAARRPQRDIVISDEDKLTTFESFATICERERRANYYDCDQLRTTFDNSIRGNTTDQCVSNYVNQIELLRLSSPAFFYRFYFALSKIRKSQNRYDDWIENLALAFSRTSPGPQQDNIFEKLDEAKRLCSNRGHILNPETEARLRQYNLIERWTTIQTNQFNTPEQAGRIASNYREYNLDQCNANKRRISIFVNTLIARLGEPGNEEYLEILNNNIQHFCFTPEEITNFYDRIQSLSTSGQ